MAPILHSAYCLPVGTSKRQNVAKIMEISYFPVLPADTHTSDVIWQPKSVAQRQNPSSWLYNCCYITASWVNATTADIYLKLVIHLKLI